jgi:signal transduction histidine kinase
MLGKKPGDLWGGLMSREFYDEMWETIRNQKTAFVGELQNCRKNGQKYWQEVHILPVLDEKGDPAYYIGIELNIDDEERRQRLLSEYQRHAPHVEKTAQIRWPLGWLMESGNLSSQQMEELQQQYAKDGSLDTLIEDLIAISNVVFANRQKDDAFNAVDLLEEIIDDLAGRFPDHKVALHHDGISEMPLVENKKLLRDALSRIIANAAQYSEPTAGEIILYLLKTKHLCIITCQDNGIGIAFHEQKRMFDKFFRGARARRVNPTGSGLGLYLVKSIAFGRLDR